MQLALLIIVALPAAVRGAAVDLADDDVLADVDHAAGQITGVGGTERGIGQALSSAFGTR